MEECEECGHFHENECDECTQCLIAEAENSGYVVEPEKVEDEAPLIKDPSFNPIRGKRRSPRFRGAKPKPGRMRTNRMMWLSTSIHNFICFVGRDEEYEQKLKEKELYDEGHLPSVSVDVRSAGRKYPLKISLTGMTEKELLAFGEMMRLAVARALPVSRELDARAKEAYQNGDTAFARLYRPVPQLFVRERSIEEHAEGISLGYDGPLEECDYVYRIYAEHPPKQLNRLIDDLEDEFIASGAYEGDGVHDSELSYDDEAGVVAEHDES